MSRYLLSLLLMVVIIAACGSESTECSRTSDCFQGEVCDSGACIPDGTQPTNNPSTNNPNNLISNNSPFNTFNNSPENNTPDPNLPVLECVADPFTTTCESPDENDSSSESFRQQNAGCIIGDEFTPMDETRSAQLCIREMSDRYTQGFIPCDTRSFIMEIHFTPKSECDQRVFEFSVNIDGKNCEEPNEEIRCDELSNGGVKVTAVVRPGRNVALASFVVEALHENAIHFDYDLRWVMRE